MTGPSATAHAYRLTDRVARSRSAEAEDTEGETFVLDLDSGRYFSLGEVGGFIWRRLDGTTDLGAIADAVSNQFEVSAREAGDDLLEFIGMLDGLGLIDSTAAE